MSHVRSARTLPLILIGAIGFLAPSASASTRSLRIPRLTGSFIAAGYARLHHDGLRVTISRGFVVDSLAGGGEIVATSPAAGRTVIRGSTVSLTVGCRFCALGSPAVPTHIPSYRVPNFAGAPLTTVLGWVDPKTLYLTEHFGPIHNAAAAEFSANYHVAAQHPAPGATLRLGIGHKIGRNGGEFLPTPLTVWLAANRPR